MYYLLGAGAVALGAFFIIKKVLSPGKKHRKRALSFSSEILIRGAFPEKSKVWQPNINAIFYLKKCPSIEKCVGKCHALLYYDRFRSSFIRLPNGTFDFIDLKDSINPEKDLLVTIEVNSIEEIHTKIDQLNREDIDYGNGTKPVWKLYRFINKNGDSAVYFRLHHALGDGIALLGTMRKMFEDSNGDPVRFEMAEKMGGGVNRKVGLKTLWKFVVSFFEVLGLASSAYDSDVKFTDPDKPNLVMTDKRKTIFFPVVNLDFVKDVKNHAKVSVNDVLMSAMSGAIRRYSELKNDALVTQSKKRLLSRALLPVAFPRPVKDTSTPNKSLRNLWSFVSAPLPINGKTAQDRLMICAKATKRLKSSPQALVQLLLQNNVVARLPQFLCRKITQDVFSRHTMVFSNLPGPTNPMFFADERVLGLQVIFPNLIPQVLIVSYANGVYCNMSLDPELVDECDKLPQLFLEELAEVAKAYGVNADPSYMVQPRPAN